MPRKVFISFLGTSDYKECTYFKEGFSYKSRFIQEATFQYLTTSEEWTEQDRILILLTKEAEIKNWKDNGQTCKNTDQVNYRQGLESVLKSRGFRTPIDTLRDLPEGKNEQEINQVFERIYNAFQEGDSLYFDLTHSFRYFPMLMLVLGNYAKFLKRVSIKSITYGNWEMSEKGSKPAPIIDLLSLSELQNWTFAAGQFIESGNADQLVSLSKKEYTPILRETLGLDESARRMRSFTETLEKIISERQSCRGLDIFEGKSIKKINREYQLLSIDSSKPYSPIFRKIADSWSGFNEDSDVLNGIRAAQWCYSKGLFLQAATLLEETVLYYFCLKFGLNPLSEDDRYTVSGAFTYASYSLAGNDSSAVSERAKVIGGQILRDFRDVVNPFQILRINIRNDFNHAGIRNAPGKSETIISKLKKQLDTISNILLEDKKSISDTTHSSVFINISNHPSMNWSSLQLERAKRFGDIVDIDFPTISPCSSEEDIESLAHQVITSILNNYPAPAFVHIMGEMTLTYTLVTELKALGYTCLASTTERNVTVNEDGDKIVHFKFIRFREY